jgi:hypothetical protein
MRRLVFTAVVAALAVGVGATAAAAAKRPAVLPPSSHPYGHTYGEWQARWNQWSVSLPVPESPGLDETGEKCANGQTGPVWFTAFATHAGTTLRACTIPSGKALFVLVAANECSNVEPPPFFGSNEAELRDCATAGYEAFWGDAVLALIVDGVPVPDLLSYRTITPLFGFTLPDDNIYGLPPGAWLGVADGVYAMIAPPSVGTHTVVIHIESPVLGTIDEIYDLTVVPRGQY